MARCGEGVGLGFAAQRAGGDGLASRDAGRFRFVGFLPVMGAGIRAWSSGTAGDHVIDVVSITALDNGNVFVSVGDGDRVAGFSGYRVAAVLIVVRPIGDSGAFTSGGIEKLVSGFVDNAGVVGYLGELAVVTDYAVIAGNAGRAGSWSVGIMGNSCVWNDLIIGEEKINCKCLKVSHTLMIGHKRVGIFKNLTSGTMSKSS